MCRAVQLKKGVAVRASLCGLEVPGWHRAHDASLLRTLASFAALVVVLFVLSGVAPARADQTNSGLRQGLGALAGTPLLVAAPDLKRHRSASKLQAGISLTPSAKTPYYACPEGACEAIIDPRPVKISGHYALPAGGPLLEGSGELGGYDPQDLQSAYGIPTTGGSTQTIALIDAYGDATAESDLATYRETYGLEPCTAENGCFRKVNEQGEEANYPSPPPPGNNWEVETALDLDMASAACPSCHILLVEATTESPADTGESAERAASLGATEISNSYGYPEEDESLCGTTGCEQYSADYNIPGVVVTASAGDAGYDDHFEGRASPNFPATSPSVIAVGGTNLHKASNSRGWSEEVWDHSGSGCSQFEPKPAWQAGNGCADRTDNDVAAVAGTATPVSIYSTADGGWEIVGGTSASAPLIAGIEAHATEYTRSLGAETFYRDPGALFDVTKGSNGTCTPPTEDEYLCHAEVGYDGPTGNGTPNGVPNVTPPPELRSPPNRAISPGTIVGFPGTLPVPETGGDSVTLKNSKGAAVPVTVMDWEAGGVILRIPPTTPVGEYQLTATDEGGSSSPLPVTLTAPTDPSQTITPVGTGAASSLPLGVAEDQAGNLWFSDAASNSIGELLPGGTIREYPLLTPNSGPTGAAIDQAGNIWVTDNTAGQVTELDVSSASPGTAEGETNYTLASGAHPDQLSVDPYGNVWVAEGDGVLGKITVAPSGEPRPVQEWLIGADLEGMVVDSFGNVWAVDEDSGIDEILPSQLPAPTTSTPATSGVYHVAGSGGAEQIEVAPNGDIWFTQWGPAVLGAIVPSPTSPTEDQYFTAANYPTTGGAPSGIGIDAAGNIFVEDAIGQAIYKFSPATFESSTAEVAGTWTEYQVGSWITNYSEGDEGNDLAVTPSGNVLFSGYQTNGGYSGTPYDSTSFVQGYLGTLPGVASPSTETVIDGKTEGEVVSGTSGDEVVIPADTFVTTSDGTAFDGTIPPPVVNTSFVPPAEFGTSLLAFSVAPELSDGVPTHLLFSAPVTVTFTFPLPEGVSPEEAEAAEIWYYDSSTETWVEAGTESGDPGGSVTVSGGEVTATIRTMHLSSFALLKHAAGAPDIASVSPNPATPGSTIIVDGSSLGALVGHVTLTPAVGTSGGPVSLPVSSWSESKVTAQLPSGQAAGNYTVALQTQPGTATNSLALRVVSPLPVNIELPTATTTSTKTTTPPPAATAATGSVSLDGSTITVQSSGKAAVKLTCTGTTTCAGKLKLTVKSAAKKGKKKSKKVKTETLGTASFTIAAGKTATIKLTLNETGRALLSATHGHLSATLMILKSLPAPAATQTKSVHLVLQKAAKAKKGKKQ